MGLSTSLQVLVSIVSLIASVSGKGDGGPSDATTCETLLPRHGNIEPQKKPFPYTIYMSKSEMKSGDIVKIQIYSSNKNKLKGFYLQGRKENEKDMGMMPMGIFAVEEGYENSTKLIKCGGDRGVDGNTVTHSHSMDKDKITVQWIAPSTPGIYTILCTVVKNGVIFWAPQPSFKITVQK